MTTKVRAANGARCRRCGKPRWSAKSELCPACFSKANGNTRKVEGPATKDLWSTSSPEEDALPSPVADRREDHVPLAGQLTREQLENRAKVDAEVQAHLAFVGQVADMLQESGEAFYQIHLITRILGVDRVIALLKETLAIEQSGGMMMVDGTQRRTPGGVFFRLVKQQYSKQYPAVRRAAWKVGQDEKPLPIASSTHLAQS